MRSSACKYVLDKVSKFEKKYSKTLQKSNEKEEDDSISSRSFESEFKTIQTKFKSCRNSILSDRESETLDKPRKSKKDTSELTNSYQNSCREEKNKIVTIRRPSIVNQSGIVNENILKYHGTDYKTNLDCSDAGSIHLSENQESAHVSDVVNKLSGNNFHIQKNTYADDTLKLNFVPSEDEESMINESGTSNRVDAFGGGTGRNRLQVNLNLKLEEDPDEVSEMSNNDIASLSQENLDSSQNIPFRILMFEDLIRVEEVKSVDEKPNPVVEGGNKLDSQHVYDNSISSLLVADANNSEGGGEDDKSLISSEVEYLEEILTSNRESIDESSVEEEIKIQESSVSEISYSSHTSENNVHHLKVIEHNNEIVTENREKESKLMSISPQTQSCHSCDERVSDLGYNFINDDKKENKIGKRIHKEAENNDRQLFLFDPKRFYVEERSSDHEFKLTVEKNKVRQKNMKHVKYTKEKHKGKEYSNHRIKPSCKSNSAVQTNLCHVLTQTDNFLTETCEFEKRMGTIMNSSFDFMTTMNNFYLEDSNISTGQDRSASGLLPLERGFQCSLRQQVELIKHFVHAEYKMYAVCVAAIKEMSATYKPSTLHSIRVKQKTSGQKTCMKDSIEINKISDR